MYDDKTGKKQSLDTLLKKNQKFGAQHYRMNWAD